MSKFKVGDRVVQVKDSDYSEHSFPVEEYPVLTVSEIDGTGIKFEEQRCTLSSHMQERFELLTSVTKDTNPKDAVGIRKAPMSTVSAPVIAEVGVAMLEGARKYGRHNYRVAGVRGSVYYDAAMRHLMQWWEGENLDPDSGMSHVTKAIASLVVLRDAMINDKLVDDRPPAVKVGFIRDLEEQVNDLFDKYPDAKEAHTNE